MKTHYIYASAIVLSALILGFFYALAHHYERVHYRGEGYMTMSRWTGKALPPSIVFADTRAENEAANPRP